MSLAKKLDKLLKTRNAAALARDAGVSAAIVCLIRRGKTSPKLETLKKIAAAMDVSVAWLVDDSAGFPPIYTSGKAA